MPDRIIRAVLTGDDAGLIKTFEHSATASGDAASKMAEHATGLSKVLGSPYVKVATTVVAMVATVAGAAAAMASHYDDATDRMAAAAGITQQQAKAVGDAFLGTAFQSTFSAQRMMEAYGPVSGQLGQLMGGALSASDALDVMHAATDGAEASGGDLGATTAALSNTLVAFQLSTSSASLVMDDLYNSSRLLNQPITDISSTVDKLKGKLGEAAPSLQQTSALMVAMAGAGLPARQAVSGVDTALTGLLTPSKAQETLLKNLHVSTLTATGSFVGMDSIINQLGPRFDKMTEAQRLSNATTLFGKGAAEAMLSVIGQGSAAFDAQVAAIGKAGSAHSAAATATDNLSGAVDHAKAGVADFMVKIGQGLTPIITNLVNWFNNNALPALNAFWKTIQDHLPQIQAGFRTFGDVVGAVVNRLGIVIPIVIGVIVAVITRIVIIVQVVVAIIQKVIPVVAAIIGVVIAVVSTVVTVIANIVTAVISVAAKIAAVVAGIIGFFVSLPGNIVNGLKGFASTVWGFLTHEFDTITSNISGWISTAVTFFTSLPGKMGQAFQSFGGDLAAGFKTVVNDAIIKPIDAALRWIGDLGGSIGPISFHVRDAFGGKMPQIPTLDTGGIVSRPTLALLAMNSQPEAVVPLSAMTGVAGSGAGGSRTVTIYQNFTLEGNDTELLRKVQDIVEQNNADLGRAVTQRAA